MASSGNQPTPSRAAADWRASEPLHNDPSQPSIPAAVKIGGAAAIGILLIGALLIGVLLGGGFQPTAAGSTSPSPKLIMEPPVQIGAFVRGDVIASEVPAPGTKRIVHATYKDGANEVLLMMTWPEEDLGAPMEDAAIEAAPVDNAEGKDTRCGTSLDSSLPGCGRLVDSTALLVISIQGTLTESDVLKVLDEFERSVTP